jgi:hypothetical protein
MDRINLRNRNSVREETRRKDIACLMLCNELPDVGMHRMRSYGKRYKLAKDGALWANIPSLAGTHVFSSKDEALSASMMRHARKQDLHRPPPHPLSRGVGACLPACGHVLPWPRANTAAAG